MASASGCLPFFAQRTCSVVNRLQFLQEICKLLSYPPGMKLFLQIAFVVSICLSGSTIVNFMWYEPCSAILAMSLFTVTGLHFLPGNSSTILFPPHPFSLKQLVFNGKLITFAQC